MALRMESQIIGMCVLCQYDHLVLFVKDNDLIFETIDSRRVDHPVQKRAH